MLSKEDFRMIEAMKRRGVFVKDIAAELGVDRKTVSRALARGAAPGGQRGRDRTSKLDPHKPTVDRLLSEGVWNAMVILREIEAEGYSGQASILRDYIRPKRVLRSPKATVRFETEPGRQLQSDWGEEPTEIGGKEQTVDFIVNLLGYSRRFHFWCTDSQDAEHTYEGLIRSFEYFGGVTDEVLVDNQKAAVLDRPGGQARFQARFVDLATTYGFVPRACRPYRARTKGKDERMVGYIKGNFFVRYRRFESWAHLNQLAERWLVEEADQRLHGTVHELVAERFAREAPQLGALPASRYDTSYYETRQVSWDGYIEVRGNRYSVPHGLQGRTLGVRIGLDDSLRILDGPSQVASHRLQPAALGWVSVPAHHRPLWQETLGVEHRDLEAYQEAAAWN